MNKILITGAGGFVAPYLINLFKQQGQTNLVLTDLRAAPGVRACDLSISTEVIDLIRDVKPTHLFHLAGSFTNNFEVDLPANFTSTKNLFDAVLQLDSKTRILLMGSAAEYGGPKNALGITEEFPLNPVTIYGFTKKLQSDLMAFYFQNYALDVVMARSFNLSGKGISPRLFVGTIYEQIQRYRAGKIAKITVGDLSSERDYIKIEHAVELYLKIMTHGKAGEVYNVGTGSPIKLSAFLKKILAEEGLDLGVIEETNFSSSKISISFADIQKLKALGE